MSGGLCVRFGPTMWYDPASWLSWPRCIFFPVVLGAAVINGILARRRTSKRS